MDSIFAEIDLLISDYDITEFLFVDELFIDDTDFIMNFCKRIKPYRVKWFAQARVDYVTVEVLDMMKDSGCVTFSFGTESIDETVLKSMRKKITVRQVENAFECAAQVGLPAVTNFIFGDLAETPETIRNCLDYYVKHSDYDIRISYIRVYPGSFIYEDAVGRGIIKDRVQYLKEGCPQINITQMSDAEYWSMVDEIELFKYIHSYRTGTNDNLVFNATVFREKIMALVDKGKVAIWPITLHSVAILSKYAPDILFLTSGIYLINMNYETRLMLEHDERIQKTYAADIITEDSIEIVLVPHTQTMYKNIEAIIRDCYPCVRQVISITDLLEET